MFYELCKMILGCMVEIKGHRSRDSFSKLSINNNLNSITWETQTYLAIAKRGIRIGSDFIPKISINCHFTIQTINCSLWRFESSPHEREFPNSSGHMWVVLSIESYVGCFKYRVLLRNLGILCGEGLQRSRYW